MRILTEHAKHCQPAEYCQHAEHCQPAEYCQHAEHYQHYEANEKSIRLRTLTILLRAFVNTICTESNRFIWNLLDLHGISKFLIEAQRF